MTLFRSLTHRPFALLWAGQTISRAGDMVYRVSLAWWVLEKTHSAAAMGTVLIFSTTPMLIFLLIGGVAVDRLPRVRVMLGADFISGAAVGLVAALAWANTLEIWHIYVASLVLGFVQAFFYPAYAATVPEVTPPELLPSANSLTSLSTQLMGLVGPAIGAFIVSQGGTSLAFTLDAVSFLLSAACLLLLRYTPARLTTPRPPRPMLAELRDGLHTVWQLPWVWITIAAFGFINVFLGGPRAAALPLLVDQNLGGDVNTLGWLQSLTAVGAVTGAVWLGRFTRLRRRGWLAYGSTILSGLFLAVLGLPLPFWVLAGAAFLGGVSIEVFGLIWVNSLQEQVPPEKMGRVVSIDALGSFVLLPIAYGLTGIAADAFGAPLTFIAGGLIGATIAALVLLHPAIHGLD